MPDSQSLWAGAWYEEVLYDKIWMWLGPLVITHVASQQIGSFLGQDPSPFQSSRENRNFFHRR